MGWRLVPFASNNLICLRAEVDKETRRRGSSEAVTDYFRVYFLLQLKNICILFADAF
jgi:hypothetical protein